MTLRYEVMFRRERVPCHELEDFMKAREFKKVATRAILGKRLTIKEYVHGHYFQIGTCRLPATNIEDAISRYIACKSKEGAK